MLNKNEVVENKQELMENVQELMVRENENFVVMQDENGKYKRKAKFKNYMSFEVKTRAEKIWLANLTDVDVEDSSDGLKSHVGKQIEVEHIMTRQYDKINEDTGQLEYGVITYLITPEKTAYATSSKSVYFKVIEHMELFGTPDTWNGENLTYKVFSKKGQNGDQILIKLV